MLRIVMIAAVAAVVTGFASTPMEDPYHDELIVTDPEDGEDYWVVFGGVNGPCTPTEFHSWNESELVAPDPGFIAGIAPSGTEAPGHGWSCNNTMCTELHEGELTTSDGLFVQLVQEGDAVPGGALSVLGCEMNPSDCVVVSPGAVAPGDGVLAAFLNADVTSTGSGLWEDYTCATYFSDLFCPDPACPAPGRSCLDEFNPDSPTPSTGLALIAATAGMVVPEGADQALWCPVTSHAPWGTCPEGSGCGDGDATRRKLALKPVAPK